MNAKLAYLSEGERKKKYIYIYIYIYIYLLGFTPTNHVFEKTKLFASDNP
jgi:hypothetical protein